MLARRPPRIVGTFSVAPVFGQLAAIPGESLPAAFVDHVPKRI